MYKLSSVLAILFLLCTFSISAEPRPLPRSSPETQGVSSQRLIDVVSALDSQVEGLHSIMIVRHGQVIAEGWWTPYAAEHNHVLYSLSKSFTSTAVGMAVAEGKLSIDDKVLSFFPEAAPDAPDGNLKQMRVRDLLTMATGHQIEPTTAIDKVSAKLFLAQEVPFKPGTHFQYNTAATFMLSAILEKQTGAALVDYLRPRLFEPLGIEKPKWDTNFEGIALGGYGLRVRTEDIAKLGQLYLQQGEWEGRRLLDKNWVALATSRQVSNGSNPDSDWDQGYGFQFWQCRHGAYRGDGAFGQYCVVMPEQDTVVAITSGLGKMQDVLDVLWDTLLPAFHDVPLAENVAASEALHSKLANLVLPTLKGEMAGKFSGSEAPACRFTTGNDEKLESVRTEIGADGTLTLISTIDGVEFQQPCGHGKWVLGGSQPDGEKTAGCYAWRTPNELTVKVCAYETPFVTTWNLLYGEADRVILKRKRNVGFGPAGIPVLTGPTQ